MYPRINPDIGMSGSGTTATGSSTFCRRGYLELTLSSDSLCLLVLRLRSRSRGVT